MKYLNVKIVSRLFSLYVFTKVLSLIPFWALVIGEDAVWVNLQYMEYLSKYGSVIGLVSLSVPILSFLRPKIFIGLLLLEVYSYVYVINPFIFNGSGQVLINLLFLITIFYLFSFFRLQIVDRVKDLILFAMKLQVCMVYSVAGISKLFSIEWINGEAVRYMLVNRLFHMSSLNELLAQSDLLINLGTHSFIAFELCFILIIVFRSLRVLVHISGAFFHIGGLVLLGIEGFPEVMIVSYLLFYSTEDLNLLWRKLKNIDGIKFKKISSSPPVNGSLTIIFDSNCLLCNSIVRKIFNVDNKGEIMFATFDSQYFFDIKKKMSESEYLDKKSVYVVKGGKVYSKMNAVFIISDILGGIFNLLFIFRYFPSLLNNTFYDFVARFRDKIEFRKSLCKMPSNDLKNRVYA
ncbi:MAG: DCC1-like thiol-disulfide oxidoreductase family protein [Bacteroidota bacterium]